MDVVLLRQQRGLELRNLRKQKGKTQGEMAKITGVSLPSIMRMEKGEKNWRIDLELIFRETLLALPDKKPKEKRSRKIPA